MATVNKTRVGAPAKATGGIYIAPIGTALPTDAEAELDSGFKITGLIGEDGLSEEPERSTEPVNAWGGHLARVLQTEYSHTVTFTYIERTKTTLEEVFGAENVTVSEESGTKTAITKNGKTLPNLSRVADMKDGNTKIRLVYPNSQITSISGTQYAHNSLIQYEVEMACYPDENGAYGYEYEYTPA